MYNVYNSKTFNKPLEIQSAAIYSMNSCYSSSEFICTIGIDF